MPKKIHELPLDNTPPQEASIPYSTPLGGTKRLTLDVLALDGEQQLSTLTDVELGGAPAAGDVLRHNGSAWSKTHETNLTDGGNF